MTSGQKEIAARVNEAIICKEIRLIDADGNMIGIISPEQANIMARDVGLDLVEISPNAGLQCARLWTLENSNMTNRKEKQKLEKSKRQLN
ncbi:MAG: hypothetical protein CM15mP98_11620 [Paracoccaceae bacterium]|nr:MAG: hypothetical protein CM15mP98_11620 [Paracoccaceae bacterium]